MSMIFKLWKGEVAVDFEHFFQPKQNCRTRVKNNIPLYKPNITGNIHKNSFFYRSIDDWNDLEQSTRGV